MQLRHNRKPLPTVEIYYSNKLSRNSNPNPLLRSLVEDGSFVEDGRCRLRYLSIDAIFRGKEVVKTGI